MKKTFIILTGLLSAFSLQPSALGQGTAFTYQGRLNDGANPASGSYDLRFALFDAAGGGAQQGNTLTNAATAISNGLFTVTLDFGNQFPGANRWLEIGVRTNGAGAFATLSSRQQLTSTPYAVQAGNASSAAVATTATTASSVAAVNITGVLSTTQIPNIDASKVTSGTFADARLSANIALRSGGNIFTQDQIITNGTLYNYAQAVVRPANPGWSAITEYDGTNNITGFRAFVGADGFGLTGATNQMYVGTYTAHPLGFFTVAAQRMIITAAGNVGIGTSSPGAKLDVNGSVRGASFQGDGGGLNNLSAAQLTSIGNTNGGSGNFFVGPSGNTTTSGSVNTAYGVSAFANNTSGTFNTANGYAALANNTSGSANTANGYGALASITSGSLNIALGAQAGSQITTGSSNIDIGNPGFSSDNNLIRIGSGQAQTFIAGVINGNGGGLFNLSAAQLISIGNNSGGDENFFAGPSGNDTTSGLENTANGWYALYFNTSGSFNTANGDSSLYSNTSGSYNTANGGFALFSNTNGSGNTANGYQALENNISGNNTASGFRALASNTSGSNNTANGYLALVSNTSGSGNTADGYGALDINTSGSNNVALGYFAGMHITTGSSNIDIGNVGLSSDNNLIRIGSGQAQTFIAGVINGNGGGLSNVSGAQLISIGNTGGGSRNFFAGPSGNAATSGSDNTANGDHALLSNTSGSDNTANGTSALFSNTSGLANTANGSFALALNTIGLANTANGDNALHANTSGSYNTANGVNTLDFNTSGSNNTANGYFALHSNTSGSGNTADGYGALFSNTSGSNNIALGGFAGFNITTGSFNIDIGNDGLASDTNIIRIGSSQTQTFIAGVINGDGSGLTLPANAALRSGGNTFTGDQINYGTLYNYAQAVVRPANPGWSAITEYDGTNDISGFRAFVGADGVGLTGVPNQMFVGTLSSHPVKFFTGGVAAMTIATTGFIGIGNNSPNHLFMVASAYCDGATWQNGSDRNAKQDFATVDPREILEKVSNIPITEWSYKVSRDGEKHLGPMAQDFHDAFGLNGADDTHIATVDEAGVALAAIQGLNQKVEQKEAEIAELKQRLEKIEQLLIEKNRGAK